MSNGHARGINNFMRLKGDTLFHDRSGTGRIGELDARRCSGVADRDGLFGFKKITFFHVSDVCSTIGRPNTHDFRIGLRKGFDGCSNTTVGITFAQDWIDGTT